MTSIHLTPVELAFLRCIAEGLTEKDMVREHPIFKGYASTNSIRCTLYRKLGIHSAPEALLWAIKHRCVEVKRVPAERANLQRRIFLTD